MKEDATTNKWEQIIGSGLIKHVGKVSVLKFLALFWPGLISWGVDLNLRALTLKMSDHLKLGCPS